MNGKRCVGTVAAAAAAVIAVSGPAGAEPAATTYGTSTSVGVHNAYDKEKYHYFADALDSGAALLELDLWSNGLGRSWRVSHSNPLGNNSNCEGAANASELRTKNRDQDFAGCLADMKAWHDAHPGHRPILLKVEMKDGFNAKGGRGPAEFDALVRQKLGDAVYGPGDLTGRHATADEAVRAGGWPSRADLAGKFLFELIPGTVEEKNPFDKLWTDVEYAGHLKSLAAQGKLAQSTAFPAVHGAAPGDPRERYTDPSLRPWFVVFDGDAATYLNGSIDTSWYDTRNYLLIMTDAHNVPPVIDGTHPTEAQALARVRQLAAAHASFATADWYPLPSVLKTVVPRGA
ncbi:phosphatidylinositol-specific phospholipase C domain-containing protein [Streptomyces sp. DSM 41527]|uniref:Phosphatidylinositol-specific phospholipase C domain-containing protein n=1 Tax=Streptomyces mooreae TaxID=3075523 RepID=A0ABU2TEC9_9ACTN|nr:phosphatidylinositol-specific phospholipase C domain-containing protein [Streptomyces sp. DSM 41527]MDT0459304.1 phosphatidylinositol-specific phospholipase C domain-containing protein [Streptomyces sp. DSM 41527]